MTAGLDQHLQVRTSLSSTSEEVPCTGEWLRWQRREEAVMKLVKGVTVASIKLKGFNEMVNTFSSADSPLPQQPFD